MHTDQNFLSFLGPDWTTNCDNLWELLTLLILDTRTPVERVASTGKYLKKYRLLDFRVLHELAPASIAQILREAGYPWYNQKAKNLGGELPNWLNLDDDGTSLYNASYNDIMMVEGVGPKLASLWMRLVHNRDYPIVDTHVKRWLRGLGYDEKDADYDAWSLDFIKEARDRNVSISELDMLIVENGIRKRKGLELRTIPERGDNDRA